MTGLTRRAALIGAMIAPTGRLAFGREPAPQPVPLPPPGPADLRSAAHTQGRFFGAAVQDGHLRGDFQFREAVLAQCDSLTPELALKWAAAHPAQDRFDFAAMDEIAAFARTNGKRVHGHTLLWHRSVPDWALAALAAKNWEPIHRYFGAAIPRYQDLIDYWDVVNEPLEIAGEADGLRRSPFFAAFGPDYIRRALHAARSLAPEAKLLINDYGLEHADAEGRARRRALLALIDGLRRQGAPLDGVGLQAHLDLARGVLDQTSLAAFLHELASRGLTVLVTELDVREADTARPLAERDEAVADAARAFLEVALDQPAVKGITTWGLSDRYSWLNAEGEGSAMRPGRNRGLPLDVGVQPKPFFHAALAALQKPPFFGNSPGGPLPGPSAGEGYGL